MAFRDDREALLARNEALEREVNDTKRALAQKERELAQATHPSAAETTPESLEPPTVPTGSVQSQKERGRALAADLISGDAAKVTASLHELRNAGPVVTDAAAGAISGYLHGRGAQARAVCEVYVAHDPPKFGGSSHNKILRAFVRASEVEALAPLAERAMSVHVTQGIDARYLEKRDRVKASGSPKSLPMRLLSVFMRAWVIVAFGFPALFAIIALFTVPGARLIIGSALVAYALLVVAIDAYLRRCPSCRRWLAGTFLHVIRDEYDFHVTSWSCTFCKRGWKSKRIASPS
jgi:hypothetical protein